MDASWLIAVLLAAMASFISNLGVTLQKLHHLRAEAVSEAAQSKEVVDGRNESSVGSRSSVSSSTNGSVGTGGGPLGEYLQGWLWRVGLFLVFFGSLADFAALSFGPQSLVAPLGSLTLVSNVIFAPLLLRETIGRWDLVATGLIVIGSSVAVIFGSHEAVTFTVFELFGFFMHWDFVLYAVLVSIYGLMLYLVIQKMERIEVTDGVHSARYRQYRALHRFAYPSLSGTVGAQSVLFAKCVVELLSNTVRHWRNSGADMSSDGSLPDGAGGATNGTLPDGTAAPASEADFGATQNMFLYPQTYLVILAMLGAITGQIKYLNDGLRRFDASYSVPVFTSHWIILSVVSGMIFYREYRGMDGVQCMLFAMGVLITVVGVTVLGGREQTHNRHPQHAQLAQHDDVDGDEELELSLEDEFDGRHSRVESIGDSSEPIRQHDACISAHADAYAHDQHTFGRSVRSSPRDMYAPTSKDELSLDVEMANLGSPSLAGVRNGGPASASHASSSGGGSSRTPLHGSVKGSHPAHVSVALPSRASLASSRDALELDSPEESSLAEGAKTVVLEASRQASQQLAHAFNKLRRLSESGSPYSASNSPYAVGMGPSLPIATPEGGPSPRMHMAAGAGSISSATPPSSSLSSRARGDSIPRHLLPQEEEEDAGAVHSGPDDPELDRVQHEAAAHAAAAALESELEQHMLEEEELGDVSAEEIAADTLIQALKAEHGEEDSEAQKPRSKRGSPQTK